jgi:hypothetical protein
MVFIMVNINGFWNVASFSVLDLYVRFKEWIPSFFRAEKVLYNPEDDA